MINTRLVIALEKLFKKEPFDLENITFNITASYGRITIDPNADKIADLENSNSDLEMNQEHLERDVEDLETKISDLKELLDENDIDY